MTLRQVLLIGFGGFLGALARFLIASSLARWLGPTFPYGTLIVNLSGSFAIGMLLVLLPSWPDVADDLRLFVAVGFLGAYTTFSTFTYEALALIQAGRFVAGLVYLTGHLVLGMLAVASGVMFGRLVT